MNVLAQAVDWQQPWLAPWHGEAADVQAKLAGGASVAEVLNTLHQMPASSIAPVRFMPRFIPHFVPQSALPADQAYEQFIFDTGQVPTR